MSRSVNFSSDISNSNSKPSLGEEQIYEETSELGKTKIGLYIGCFIGIVLLCICIYLSFFRNNKHTEKVEAIVQTKNCESGNNNTISCKLTISYTYKNIIYNPTNILNTIDGYHDVLDIITIYIDPNNPSDFSQSSKENDKGLGWFLFGFGIFTIFVSILVWLLA